MFRCGIRARVCKRLRSPKNRFQKIHSASLCSWRAGTSNRVVVPWYRYLPIRLRIDSWVYKYGLWIQVKKETLAGRPSLFYFAFSIECCRRGETRDSGVSSFSFFLGSKNGHLSSKIKGGPYCNNL
jgi:hypothetical protein